MQIATIGLDIAKNVFQVHGIDATEKVVVRKQLRRGQMLAFFKTLPRCLVGMEACATSHYWARELTKLGHQVRLMPAKDVKAYVKRNKNDAADAEAICEAVRRPTMRFVQIKSVKQQGQLMLHRARDLLMRQRTQLIDALRAHMAELGIVAAQGREGVKELLKIIASEQDARLPVDAHASLVVLAAGLRALQTMIGSIEKRIVAQHRSNDASKRLRSIPGIGIVGATAIAATVPDPKAFRSGRDFAAWIGLVPRQGSTGGKQKLGPISKQGDQYLQGAKAPAKGNGAFFIDLLVKARNVVVTVVLEERDVLTGRQIDQYGFNFTPVHLQFSSFGRSTTGRSSEPNVSIAFAMKFLVRSLSLPRSALQLARCRWPSPIEVARLEPQLRHLLCIKNLIGVALPIQRHD